MEDRKRNYKANISHQTAEKGIGRIKRRKEGSKEIIPAERLTRIVCRNTVQNDSEIELRPLNNDVRNGWQRRAIPSRKRKRMSSVSRRINSLRRVVSAWQRNPKKSKGKKK